MSRTFEDIIYSVVRRSIRDEFTMNSFSDDDDDSTYYPSDEEEEELTVESMMVRLDTSGNKAQTFASILRNSFAWPNKEINRAYNSVNGSRYNINHNTSAEEVSPSWWTILRGNDYDKTRKARSIFEYMIAQQQ